MCGLVKAAKEIIGEAALPVSYQVVNFSLHVERRPGEGFGYLVE